MLKLYGEVINTKDIKELQFEPIGTVKKRRTIDYWKSRAIDAEKFLYGCIAIGFFCGFILGLLM